MKRKVFLILGLLIVVCATLTANIVSAQDQGVGIISLEGNIVSITWQKLPDAKVYHVFIGEHTGSGYTQIYNSQETSEDAFYSISLKLEYIPKDPLEFWLFPYTQQTSISDINDWLFVDSTAPDIGIAVTTTATFQRNFEWEDTGYDWYRLQVITPSGQKVPIPNTLYDGWIKTEEVCIGTNCSAQISSWFWVWYGGINLNDPYNLLSGGWRQGDGIEGIWTLEIAGWKEGDGAVVTFISSKQQLLLPSNPPKPQLTIDGSGSIKISETGAFSAFRAGAIVNGTEYIGTDISWGVTNCFLEVCYIPSLWGYNQSKREGSEFILLLMNDGTWLRINEISSSQQPVPAMTLTSPNQIGVSRSEYQYFYIQVLDMETLEPVSWARMNTEKGPGAEQSEPGVYSTQYCAAESEYYCPVDSFMSSRGVSGYIRVCGFNDGEGLHSELIADKNSAIYDRCSWKILQVRESDLRLVDFDQTTVM